MSKNTRWSEDDLKKLGLVQNAAGDYVKVSSLLQKGKVEKFVASTIPLTDQMQTTELKIKAENAKIKGATKIEQDGITFDSKLEKYMHGLLSGAGISFAFQKEYVLQEKFRYNGEAVRAIKIIVDFELPQHNMIIDTKGHQLADGKIKYKLLKWHLANMPGEHPKIEMPRNREECDLLLNRILYDKKP